MVAANGQQVIVQQQPQPQAAQVLSLRAPNGQVVNINQAGTAVASSATSALSAAASAAAAPATTVNIPGIGNVQVTTFLQKY